VAERRGLMEEAVVMAMTVLREPEENVRGIINCAIL
jgi:hypothetical protein